MKPPSKKENSIHNSNFGGKVIFISKTALKQLQQQQTYPWVLTPNWINLVIQTCWLLVSVSVCLAARMLLLCLLWLLSSHSWNNSYRNLKVEDRQSEGMSVVRFSHRHKCINYHTSVIRHGNYRMHRSTPAEPCEAISWATTFFWCSMTKSGFTILQRGAKTIFIKTISYIYSKYWFCSTSIWRVQIST